MKILGKLSSKHHTKEQSTGKGGSRVWSNQEWCSPLCDVAVPKVRQERGECGQEIYVVWGPRGGLGQASSQTEARPEYGGRGQWHGGVQSITRRSEESVKEWGELEVPKNCRWTIFSCRKFSVFFQRSRVYLKVWLWSSQH